MIVRRYSINGVFLTFRKEKFMDEQDPVKTITEVAKTAKEVLPQTTTQADGALATLVGWFNNVVLYPVKKANITYQYKLECFKDDLYSQAVQIPEQCQHQPNLMVAGPALEALKYTYDEEKLREMYIKLLTSSMDSRKDTVVHPSYVQVIQQMNSYDAVLFKFLASRTGNIKAINPNVGIKGTNKIYVNAMPEWYIAWEQTTDVFQLSAAIVRLSNLGLVELMYDRTAGTDGYENLENSPQLLDILHQYQTNYPTQELELNSTRSVIYVNDYGKQFAIACL